MAIYDQKLINISLIAHWISPKGHNFLPYLIRINQAQVVEMIDLNFGAILDKSSNNLGVH